VLHILNMFNLIDAEGFVKDFLNLFKLFRVQA
jgi:hypothetical protein